MTRTDYEQSVANKLGIINALKDNVGDEFTALEISAAMIDPPDLKPLQIGAVLKSMVAEGLVSKRPSKNMNVYRLTKKALAWQPAPYDWRAEGAMATPPENASEPVTAKPPTAGKVNGAPITLPIAKPEKRQRPKPPVTKPADDHPWVHPPAVLPTVPKEAPITRPLPAHLETKAYPCHSLASPDPGALDPDADDLAAMALPEAPQADNPMEASSQPAVDNSNYPGLPDSSTLPTDSREDEPLSQTEITPAAISGCGGKGECGGHCANHERDSLRQQLDEQDTRLGDLAQAEATAVELESALAAAREEVEVTRAALREARENLKQVREDLGAQLDGRNTLSAEQREHIYDLLTERAKHFDELAASQRERDLLHQRLREQARNEPALMADCLMELLRLALLRIPHPDHYAGVGKMVGSEARP